MFPMFVKLEGRQCLVVGAGAVAEGKIRGLLQAGASVRVGPPRAVLKIRDWAKKKTIVWPPPPFQPQALDGASLVTPAPSPPEVNAQVSKQASAQNPLCNSVDAPDNCVFYYPAV